MNEIDIPALVRKAESGQGCALSAELGTLPFQDLLSTQTKMVELNAQNRENAKDLPPLYLKNFSDGASLVAQLYLAPPGSAVTWGQLITEEQLRFSASGQQKAGALSYACTDVVR